MMDLNDLEFNPWENYVPPPIENVTSSNEELLETTSALDNYNQQNSEETCPKNLEDNVKNTCFPLCAYKVEEKFDQSMEVRDDLSVIKSLDSIVDKSDDPSENHKCLASCMTEIQEEVTLIPIKHFSNTEPPDPIADDFDDPDDKFDNPITQEINDDVIEWECQLEIPIITLSENQLVE